MAVKCVTCSQRQHLLPEAAPERQQFRPLYQVPVSSKMFMCCSLALLILSVKKSSSNMLYEKSKDGDGGGSGSSPFALIQQAWLTANHSGVDLSRKWLLPKGWRNRYNRGWRKSFQTQQPGRKWLLSRLLHPVTRDCLIAAPYALQDALTYLIPTSALESRLFLLAKKSGETAAKFIINSHPKYFQKGIAEPPILCLLPEHFEP